jgi:hypothetical protein
MAAATETAEAESEPETFDPQELRAHSERLRLLNQAMRATQLGTYRFADFAPGDGKLLRELELIETDVDGIVRGTYLADEAELVLDRAQGVLHLRMKGAVQIWRGKRNELGESHDLELLPSDPRLLERMLPRLLAVENEWPAAAVETATRDLETRLAWKGRLDGLLKGARGAGRFELYELGAVDGFEFQDVTLLGYTDKGVLERRIRAKRMRVYVDAANDRVELRFRAGFVEGREGRFEFPEQWYQLTLPKLNVEQARKQMTGAVFEDSVR